MKRLIIITAAALLAFALALAPALLARRCGPGDVGAYIGKVLKLAGC